MCLMTYETILFHGRMMVFHLADFLAQCLVTGEAKLIAFLDQIVLACG